MKIIITFLSILSTLVLRAQTEQIKFMAPKLYPEGVTINEKQNVFYVSSVTTGTIGKVDMNGKYSVFYTDSSLKSSFGMKVNSKQNRLWVCISDPNHSKYSTPQTFKKMARIIALDLSSGKKIADIDLSAITEGKHFANDLAFDDNDNIYITDSYSPCIYKISPAGVASVFATSDMFKSVDVGLNGIVYHPDDFLIVDHNTSGSLYKIDIKNPSGITKVEIKELLPGADGMLLDKQNNLTVIVNKGINRAYRYMSNDNWKSATLAGSTSTLDRFNNPTTGFFKGSDTYLLNSKLNELSDSTKNPSKEFSVQLAKFK